MKNILLVFGLILLFTTSYAQEATVEKSVYGVQVGFLGVWGHQEARLSKQMAWRTELGFDNGIWGGDFYEKTGFLFTPVITVEPRWYFNLKKRVAKGKDISGNSGNFLSVKTSFHPDWFVISNYKNISIISDLSIVPTWGMRRNIGKHFNYETGIGLGYRHIFAKSAGYIKDEDDVALNLLLRIGYRF